MCDFMKEFESVHSHFYSSAQSKMDLNCKRGRGGSYASDVFKGSCKFYHRYEENLIYALFNLSKKKREKRESETNR